MCWAGTVFSHGACSSGVMQLFKNILFELDIPQAFVSFPGSPLVGVCVDQISCFLLPDIHAGMDC